MDFYSLETMFASTMEQFLKRFPSEKFGKFPEIHTTPFSVYFRIYGSESQMDGIRKRKQSRRTIVKVGAWVELEGHEGYLPQKCLAERADILDHSRSSLDSVLERER